MTLSAVKQKYRGLEGVMWNTGLDVGWLGNPGLREWRLRSQLEEEDLCQEKVCVWRKGQPKE